MGFPVAALLLARVSRSPRTYVSGARVTGLVLALTSAAILLTRLLDVIRGG